MAITVVIMQVFVPSVQMAFTVRLAVQNRLSVMMAIIVQWRRKSAKYAQLVTVVTCHTHHLSSVQLEATLKPASYLVLYAQEATTV
jgi:hypothetical protein